MGLRAGAPVRPYQKQTVNAGSAVTVDWNSRDAGLGQVTLSSLRYRIDNLTDSVVIKDWTAIADPDPKGNLTIPASLNAMTRDYRDRQLNQVTFDLTDENENVEQQLRHYELSAVFEGLST